MAESCMYVYINPSSMRTRYLQKYARKICYNSISTLYKRITLLQKGNFTISISLSTCVIMSPSFIHLFTRVVYRMGDNSSHAYSDYIGKALSTTQILKLAKLCQIVCQQLLINIVV